MGLETDLLDPSSDPFLLLSILARIDASLAASRAGSCPAQRGFLVSGEEMAHGDERSGERVRED